MKARGTLAAALASAGILLAGWQAGTQAGGVSTLASGTTSSGTTGSGTTAAGATGASGTGSSGTGSSGTGSSGSTSTAAGTYKGTAVQTRFGAVQVQITVASGKITDVTALQLTDDDRKSVQISNRAAPLLRSEVLSAQSADVQTISGATVTSNAYLTSLQAAIDAANL
ncbi:FMN-binding protein [Pseudarthrobacter enclensis]|uniref:FMN-binding protein n=1 Tax=Pseudarthrobacter enclensis TaxID=993070 RepID=UPI003EE03F8F